MRAGYATVGPVRSVASPFPSTAARVRPLASDWVAGRLAGVEDTETGLFLLIVGIALSWIPVQWVSLIGGGLSLVGGVFFFLGRKAFGPRHGQNVAIACVLIIAAFLATILVAVALSVVIVGGGIGVSRDSLVAILAASLAVGAVLTVVIGFALVLFTVALQDSIGRWLLGSAWVTEVVLDAAVVVGLLGAASGTSTLADAFTAAGRAEALGVVPATLFVIAYALAWLRIWGGEIPNFYAP